MTCQHGEPDGTDSCLRYVPVFNELTEPEMSILSTEMHSRRYRRGEFVFQAGEPSDAMYIVHEGAVKVTALSEDGKERVLRFLFPGDFDGWFALFKEAVHYAYAEAVEDAVVCQIYRADLKTILKRNPDIAYRLLGLQSERLRDADEWAGSMSFMDAEARLAKILLIFITRETKPEGRSFPVAKKDLAALIGTTPETVSRKLAAFESAGYLQLEGKSNIQILDFDALEAIAGISPSQSV